MLHKTLAEVIATAEEVVAEAGEDYVYTDNYEACYYSVEGEPACLVGHVLAKWGVLPENVDSHYDGLGRKGMFADQLLAELKRDEILSVGPHGEMFLRVVQKYQDGGHAWGDALQGAKQYV